MTQWFSFLSNGKKALSHTPRCHGEDSDPVPLHEHGTYKMSWISSGLRSPQFDHPVQDNENKQGEQQHVAVNLGLASPGEELQSPRGGSQKTSS